MEMWIPRHEEEITEELEVKIRDELGDAIRKISDVKGMFDTS